MIIVETNKLILNLFANKKEENCFKILFQVAAFHTILRLFLEIFYLFKTIEAKKTRFDINEILNNFDLILLLE